jgi:hypothetical protein
MIEFDLVGLGGATVESATFLGTVLSAGHSFPPSSPSIVLLLSGYTGDGVVEFSDLLAPRSFVGMSGQLPSVAPPQTLEVAVPLDVSFAQGLLGGYLGLWAQTSSSGIFTSMDLASLENTLGVPPPTLRLVTSETLPPTPVAEPSTVLLVAGGLAAVARLRCRTNARRAA